MRCYCRCKLVHDERSPLGWTLLIEAIRPTPWAEIFQVMDIVEQQDTGRGV